MMRGQPDRLGLRDLNPGYFEEFEVGGCKIHRASPDDQVALVGAGVTLHECLAAAAELAGAGISVRVLDLYSVKPLDAGALIEACHVTGSRLVIAEDHYPEGGIGAAVLETLAAAGVPSLQIAHLAVTGLPGSGTPAELLDAAGISARHIAAAARRPAEDDLGAIVATRGAGLTPAGQPAQGKAPRLLADTQARRREHYPVAELAAHTLLVVGLGSVGREVAWLATAFGMHVIAINRTGRAEVAGVQEVRPSRFLADLLPVAHAVVLTLPLTEQTRALIDAAAISRMRTGAVLVNVGRGGVVDEQALTRALQGRAAGRRRPGRVRHRAAARPQPTVAAAERADQRAPQPCRCTRTSGSSPCSPRTCAATCAGTRCSAGCTPPCSTDNTSRWETRCARRHHRQPCGRHWSRKNKRGALDGNGSGRS